MSTPHEPKSALAALTERLSQFQGDRAVWSAEATIEALKPTPEVATSETPAQEDLDTLPATDAPVSDEHGLSLLDAIKRDDTATFNRLLQDRCNPNFTDKDGVTPLHRCASYNRAEMARVLVSHHADVDAQERVRGATPLILAAAYDHLEVVQVLLDAGANPKLADLRGNTPWHAAAEVPQANFDVIEALLRAKGAVRSIKNEAGLRVGQNRFKVKPPLRPIAAAPAKRA